MQLVVWLEVRLEVWWGCGWCGEKGGGGLNQFICLLRCCGLSFFLVMFLEGLPVLISASCYMGIESLKIFSFEDKLVLWEILGRHQAYNTSSKRWSLCLNEKLRIVLQRNNYMLKVH